MGEFDFGQFKEIYEYLIDKLNDGDALTPEEKKVYDMLIGFANQGMNLTESGDFNSLYTAFNQLADEGTKAEFERLYGKGLTQDPNTGQITFTEPGTIIEQFMRRGVSVNDGPAQAALAQGLNGYLKNIADNKFKSMTNSYAAMTPIRDQNIRAATNAGGVASTAIGRRVPVAGVAGGGARGGAGEEGIGEPLSIDGEGQDEPGFMDKYGGALLGLLGTAGLGVGGYLLKDWYSNRDKTPEGKDLTIAESQPRAGQGAMRENDVYDYSAQNPMGSMGVGNVIDPGGAFSQNTQMPGGDQAAYGGAQEQYNPYGDMTGGSQFNSYSEVPSWQQNYSFDQPAQGGGGSWQDNYDWSPPQQDFGGWQDQGGTWDSGAGAWDFYDEQAPYQEPAQDWGGGYEDWGWM